MQRLGNSFCNEHRNGEASCFLPSSSSSSSFFPSSRKMIQNYQNHWKVSLSKPFNRTPFQGISYEPEKHQRTALQPPHCESKRSCCTCALVYITVLYFSIHTGEDAVYISSMTLIVSSTMKSLESHLISLPESWLGRIQWPHHD